MGAKYCDFMFSMSLLLYLSFNFNITSIPKLIRKLARTNHFLIWKTANRKVRLKKFEILMADAYCVPHIKFGYKIKKFQINIMHSKAYQHISTH